MKKQLWALAPFRWTGMAVIMTPIIAVAVVAFGALGLYCLMARKNPLDYIHF